MYKYAGIIINSGANPLDKVFTYLIPDKFKNIIDIGYRVKVPFGKGNRNIEGFVVELYDNVKNDNIRFKSIISLSDKKPLLDKKDLSLIKYMKDKYLCRYIDCIKVMLPSGILKGTKLKKENLISIGDFPNGKFSKETYISIYNVVKENNYKFSISQLNKRFNLSISSIKTMIKHGFLHSNESVVDRFEKRKYNNYEEKQLTLQQQEIVDSILYKNKNKFLIHGVTGSGKTEIYMNLVKNMINNNKDCIILVPEIALTPQMIERFKGRFGSNVAVFHSKLSYGQRFDEWMRVKSGKVKVAVGARSAIFLPFNNLGLIVIDEEHEYTYKSESDPKYDARDIATFKTTLNECKLVLGSATPSMETYFKCKNNEIELLELKDRLDGAIMPDISIVDMRDELKANNKSIFSRKLYDLIETTLDKKQQIILFLNRRGFSTFVSCRKCGYVFKCDNCDITLTYHSNDEYLKCHYCGSAKRNPNLCPVCGSKYVKYFGIGTEKVEREVKKLFPKARVLRMDFDTTRKKNSYEEIYTKFKNGMANVLVGTQMVAKGLDFKNVTLVGVIAADLALNLPDYKSAEKTYQLITQVSGRAGRGKLKGQVVVQTYNPENYAIQMSSNGNFTDFYKKEIALRKLMNYPPFTDILSINISSKKEGLLIKNIQNIGIILKDYFKENDKIEMLGPCPCMIPKINNYYRWQILIKGDIMLYSPNKVKKLICDLLKNDYNDLRISIDINSNNLL